MRRTYAAGFAILLTLLLSSAIGAAIEWVDVPGGVQQAAPPEQGSTDGMPLDYVYLDPVNHGSRVFPWYPFYSGFRYQQLYLAGEIGRDGTIAQMALWKTAYTSQGTFPNVSIKLCHTDVTSLTTTFATNYGGNTPIWVFHANSLLRGTGPANAWDTVDFQTNFDYNGSDNLIVEVVWMGTASGSYSNSRCIVGSGNRRAYRVNLTDTLQPTASNADDVFLNTRIGFIGAGNDVDMRCDGITAGNTEIGELSFAIAPNPLAGGFATLRYSRPKAGLATLNVFEVTGRTVLSQTLAAGRTGTASLDLRKLEAGVYLVKVTTEGFSTTQKLVVEH